MGDAIKLTEQIKLVIKRIQNDKSGENILVILSSPSEYRRTTLTKKIQQKYHNFKISVSHTTRTPRSNEVNGVDYHFITKKEFEKHK